MFEIALRLLKEQEWLGEHESCIACRACPRCDAARTTGLQNDELSRETIKAHQIHRPECQWEAAVAELESHVCREEL